MTEDEREKLNDKLDKILDKLSNKLEGVTKSLQNHEVRIVVRVQLTLREWLHRIYSITACLEALLSKVEDGEITSNEVKEAGEDVTRLVREW